MKFLVFHAYCPEKIVLLKPQIGKTPTFNCFFKAKHIPNLSNSNQII